MIKVDATTTATQLQHIIDEAAPGTTISLGAGTFKFDRTIVVDRDNVTIKGAGSDVTTILLSGAARSSGAFQIGSVIDQTDVTGSYNLRSAALEGSKTLLLRDGSDLHSGDFLWIERPNTAAYLNSIGDKEWRDDKPLRTSMVEIASVNGNAVTLRNGLAFDFAASDATVSRIETAENVKLGGFSIDSGLSASNPARFENLSSAYDRDNVVAVSAASDVKLFDISIHEAPSNGFTFAQSIFIDASNLTVDGARNKGDGGNGYAFQLRALYESKLTGLEAYDTRHAVVFASWTSEANNSVAVQYTNRDINFHGGPDHDNTVTVANSIRTDVQADYMSPTLFINTEGTSYGAPTKANANTVSFGKVYGTNKAETLTSLDAGSEIHARGGVDILKGGSHSDKLYGDAGNDVIYGSAGVDIIDGGAGSDRLRYSGLSKDYSITTDAAGRLVVTKPSGHDILTGIETIAFDDKSISTRTITTAAMAEVAVQTSGFDRVASAVDFQLGKTSDALDLRGDDAINGKGNNGANALSGNEAANVLWGMKGDDRLYGHGGDDRLYGGDGNDLLNGQAGNDRIAGGNGDDVLRGSSGNDFLNGGAGLDKLTGGAGADTFVFSSGHDQIVDFSLQQGDRLGIGETHFASASAFAAAFQQAAGTSGDSLSSLGLDVAQSGVGNDAHVTITALDDGMYAMVVDIYGASLNSLLSDDGWLV